FLDAHFSRTALHNLVLDARALQMPRPSPPQRANLTLSLAASVKFLRGRLAFACCFFESGHGPRVSTGGPFSESANGCPSTRTLPRGDGLTQHDTGSGQSSLISGRRKSPASQPRRRAPH